MAASAEEIPAAAGRGRAAAFFSSPDVAHEPAVAAAWEYEAAAGGDPLPMSAVAGPSGSCCSWLWLTWVVCCWVGQYPASQCRRRRCGF